MRLAATEAVAGLHRLGEAGKPFLASVLRVLAPETGAGSDVVARAVRTAASIDAQDPAVRTACAKALDDPSPDVRYAAAWGILKARNATAAERDAVRKRADDPRIKALLDAVEAPKPGG